MVRNFKANCEFHYLDFPTPKCTDFERNSDTLIVSTILLHTDYHLFKDSISFNTDHGSNIIILA